MDALSRALDDDSALRIDLERQFEEHLGLRLRRSEVDRWIARRLPTAQWADADRLETSRHDAAIRRKLAAFLTRVAGRPLTGRLVVEALAITNQERIRWTKDGRLPTSGTARIRRGQVISIPTYEVAEIAGLAADPRRIEEWRAADGA